MDKQTIRFENKRLLLVEDHKQTQEFMQDMIEYLGCTLDVASNGLEGVEKWNESKYDLILMDIQMPVMDGYQASVEIRRLEKETSSYTPILALTASALAYDRNKCLDAGMDDYLSKPITIDIIESKLKEIFSTSYPRNKV